MRSTSRARAPDRSRTAPVLKRLLRSDAGVALAALILVGYVRLVWATSRWRFVGREHGERLHADGRVWLGCFWHGRMMMMPMSWPRELRVHMMSSSSRDGRLGARITALFGGFTVWGSTSRGGLAGVKTMAEKLRAGDWAAVTPDGPRGPCMRAQTGPIAIAKLARVPILPASFSSTRGFRLSSWDRLFVALPFGSGVFVVGEPIEVPEGADPATMEALRLQLENSLNRCTAEADLLCGQPAVEPEPERAR